MNVTKKYMFIGRPLVSSILTCYMDLHVSGEAIVEVPSLF